jgi:hypothetical protein
MVTVKCLFILWRLSAEADREPDGGRAGERARLDPALDLLEVGLGGGQQLVAFAGAFAGDERVAADDQPLAGIVRGRTDLGQVGLIEQRQLQLAIADQLFDLRRLERGDPADPVLLAQQLEVGLGHHAAIADHDHPLKTEARLELGDLGGHRLVIVRLAREDLDRDRPAGPVAQQSVDDLQRPPLAIARITKLGQRATTPLEIRGRDVVEHQLTIGQVAAREPVLDSALARQQPVQRPVELILIGILHAEL